MNTAWTRTAVSERLGLRWPLIQGPFGGGLSSVDLTVAVSAAGGLGSFGAHHLDAPAIETTAAAIRARTDRPFALNLWIPHQGSDDAAQASAFFEARDALAPLFDELGVPLPDCPARYAPPFDEQFEALLRVRPAVFSFVFGAPPPAALERCRAAGILTLGAATTVAEARWLEAAGVDMVVATGFEAGGHRVSFLDEPEAVLTGGLSLLPQVADAVRIPVVAAGGIADARGMAAALTLGAQAVQIGTAFLACEESGASALHRAQLFSPAAERTGLTRVFSGRLARGIRNRLMDDPPAPPAHYPLQNWLLGRLRTAATEAGRSDLMSLWCGQSAPLLRHRRADALIRALVEGVDALYARR